MEQGHKEPKKSHRSHSWKQLDKSLRKILLAQNRKEISLSRRAICHCRKKMGSSRYKR
jgi:hypothetical protein